MLVLSRKIKECITIGDGIQVTVLSMSGNRVKLGISAPVDVSIQRGPEHRTFEFEVEREPDWLAQVATYA